VQKAEKAQQRSNAGSHGSSVWASGGRHSPTKIFIQT